MAGNDDFIKAFAALTDGVTSLAGSIAVRKAQSKVDEIQAREDLDQFGKIEEQQKVANATAASLLASGVDPIRAQQARLSLAPEVPDVRMAQLKATGKGTISEAQEALKIEAEDKQIAEEERKFKREKLMQDRLFQQQKELAGMKADAKGATGSKLGRQEEDKLFQLVDRQTNLKDMLDRFDEEGGGIGMVAGRLPDIAVAKLSGPDAVAYRAEAKQAFNEYRRIITGAAAGVEELKDLKLATISETDTPENFKAKAAAIIRAGQLVAQKRLKIAKRRGKDVSGFAEEFGGMLPEDKTIDVPAGASGGSGNAGMAVNIPGFTVKKR